MILPLTDMTGFNVVMVIDGVGTRCKAWLVLAWQQEQISLTLNNHSAIYSNYRTDRITEIGLASVASPIRGIERVK